MTPESRIALLWTAGVTVGLIVLAAAAWQFGLFELTTGLPGSAG